MSSLTQLWKKVCPTFSRFLVKCVYRIYQVGIVHSKKDRYFQRTNYIPYNMTDWLKLMISFSQQHSICYLLRHDSSLSVVIFRRKSRSKSRDRGRKRRSRSRDRKRSHSRDRKRSSRTTSRTRGRKQSSSSRNGRRKKSR